MDRPNVGEKYLHSSGPTLNILNVHNAAEYLKSSPLYAINENVRRAVDSGTMDNRTFVRAEDDNGRTFLYDWDWLVEKNYLSKISVDT